jgi:hypothetical protein
LVKEPRRSNTITATAAVGAVAYKRPNAAFWLIFSWARSDWKIIPQRSGKMCFVSLKQKKGEHFKQLIQHPTQLKNI